MNDILARNYGHKPFRQKQFSTYLEKETAVMYREVMEGLNKSQKELPCKYFYDARGSRLFDKICRLDEYYLTRTELAIIQDNICAIGDVLGDDVMFIEYGSGSSEKIKILLDNFNGIKAYLPVDISREHLIKSAAQIAAHYNDLEVIPVCADYNKPFMIPLPKHRIKTKMIYFPGSTIGNFHPDEAHNFLTRISRIVDKQGGLLIGVDLKKDRNLLQRAYNDRQGLTAQFNLNQLNHINNKLDANFDLQAFYHKAFYNDAKGRVEMHLVSKEEQEVHINGTIVHFKKGESIWTESSYKYDLDEFATLAENSGFIVENVWTDNDLLFSVQYLRTAK